MKSFSFVLLLFIFAFGDVFAAPTSHLCLPEQRDALLEVKNEFEIGKSSFDNGFGCYYINGSFVTPHPKTGSWANNTDCCKWEGITCDAKSGEVIGINLSCSCLHGRFHSGSSLFKLKNLHFLTTLDLSYNDFNGLISSSIGNLSHLTSLKLSQNQFSGEIPSLIGNLSHLTSLNLRENQLSGKIPCSIGNLSHLTSLRLSYNQFWGEIPSSIGNLFHLTSLDLYANNFVGEIPSSFGSLNQLADLSVSFNKLSGKFPITLLNLTRLSDLSLDYNQFTGTLPPNITSLSNLVVFSASENAFTGTLPSSLFTIASLTRIYLRNNQLSSTLDFGNISSPSNLKVLSLGKNKFNGPIPISISKFANLDSLDLSHFNTQGPLDFSIFSHLKSLQEIGLSNLNTTTAIDLNDFLSCFKELGSLDISGNHVLAANKSSSSIPSSLSTLYLSDCNITDFPELIRTQHDLMNLDISNNKIKGQVPGWLWRLPNLYYVNLSNNTLIGFSERSPKSFMVGVFLGSNNNFTGKIPSFICSMRSLRVLDLSDNNFDGSIPRCLGNLKSNLSYLNLRRNHLSGGLPEHIFESLRSFDVGHNQLVGKLPRSLIRSSALEVLNVEGNRINDTFPFWLSSLRKLKVLVLRSNAFHGPIHQASFPKLQIIDISHNHFNGMLPSDYFVKWSAMSSLETNEDRGSDEKYMGSESGFYDDSLVLMNKGVELELVRILKIFTAIDFSGNKFEGEIPRSIGLLKELHVLSLSNNAFTGHIPSSMGNLTALESLDISQNKLLGVIPQELWRLPKFERSSKSSMRFFLVSNNNFTGKIPSFICSLRSLRVLDLSENNFNGSIPRCMGNLKYYLTDLNLRRNRLSGGLPEHLFESLRSFDVGHNQLVGKLPRSLIRSSPLEVLNVEGNRINDTFPFWLSSLRKLKVLVLRSNAFHGPIHQLPFPKLKIIDISHNHFNGMLPSDYFVKWSAMSSLETNQDRSNGEYMVSEQGYYHDSMLLMIKGVELEFERILKIFTAIDFSGNKFEGEIPRSIGLLKELHVLNLSNNAFTGHIPSSMGNLTALESLDVSQNKLLGVIPQELGSLSFLEIMNFSHNQLTGLVPGGTQFRTQKCSSFENNMGLFGPSLDEVCRDVHTPAPQHYETPESELEDEEVLSWKAAVIGFILGIAFGLTIGFMNPFGLNTRRRKSTTTHRRGF